MAPSVSQTAPLLTKAGRERVRRRLEQARATLAEAQGQLDNGAWGPDEMAEYQRRLELVQELSTVLDTAADVAAVDEDPTIVEIGDEVDVESDEGAATYALVHPAEASPADGRISVSSPLGRALLGARPGDVVVVEAPAGPYRCRLVARRRLP
ncbi:MAG: GreA/GreB family elongation factor [Actinomycetota bacterium]